MLDTATKSDGAELRRMEGMTNEEEKWTIREHRMQLWREVAVACTRAEGSHSCETPIKWANAVLDGFDKAFNIGTQGGLNDGRH